MVPDTCKEKLDVSNSSTSQYELVDYNYSDDIQIQKTDVHITDADATKCQ